jgi:predicted SAM-dependent methyltransferase
MKKYIKSKVSKRQFELLRMLSYEVKRWKCRLTAPKVFDTKLKRLHLGCGDRRLTGWLNVDLWGSDLNLDIATGKLPFSENQFSEIVSQHVIEHLTLEDELIPLLMDCHRVLEQNGTLWLSTPDLEKVAVSYVNHRNTDMIEDRRKRLPEWTLGDMPPQHFMNDIFHQQLEHRNLFDAELLEWCLRKAGFMRIDRVSEEHLIQTFSDFPRRNDDYQSLYLKATK